MPLGRPDPVVRIEGVGANDEEVEANLATANVGDVPMTEVRIEDWPIGF